MNTDLLLAAFEDELEKIAGRDEEGALAAFEDEIYKLAQYGYPPQQQQGGGWAMPVAAGLGTAAVVGGGMYGYNQLQAQQAAAAQAARRQAAETAGRVGAEAAPGFLRRMAGMAGKGILAGGLAAGGALAAGLGAGALRGVGNVGSRFAQEAVESGGKSVGRAAGSVGDTVRGVVDRVGGTARRQKKSRARLKRDIQGLHEDNTPLTNIPGPAA